MKIKAKLPRKPTLGEVFRQEVDAAKKRREEYIVECHNKNLEKLSEWLKASAADLPTKLDELAESVRKRDRWRDYGPATIFFIYNTDFRPTDAELHALEGYKAFDQFCRREDIAFHIGSFTQFFGNGSTEERMKFIVEPQKPYPQPDSAPFNPHTGPSI